MSFTKPDNAYKALAEAKQGDTYTITSEKNDKTGYWDWLSAVQGAPQEAVKNTTGGYSAPKSTYETPEERAKKQIYIARQSSLDRAVQLLSIGAKTPPSDELIFNQAQKFVDWVFDKKPPVDLFELPNDMPDVE